MDSKNELTTLQVAGLAVMVTAVGMFLWFFARPSAEVVAKDFVNAAAANFMLPQGGDYVQ